jgi:hypothetical protein
MAGHAAKKAAAAESKASAVYLALILLLNAIYIAVKGAVQLCTAQRCFGRLR